jgi:predicted O-linked N-acetylglucosamine transferase (SPINDLY family)
MGTSRSTTFGSFNALSKVQPSTLRLWRTVLAAVPGSRLVLKSSGMEADRWRARLTSAGFAPEQFELLPMTRDIPSHLAAYSRIDVALDPFPYNGTTTTCEALWMGVPVVTLAGDRHAARVGASLLTAIGHREWIAQNPGDYVRIAAALAADASGRLAWRTGLREELRASPLFDYAGQAARFGEAIRSCWARWSALSPARLVDTTSGVSLNSQRPNPAGPNSAMGPSRSTSEAAPVVHSAAVAGPAVFRSP